MLVTRIEEHSKNKKRIYIDDQFAFILYSGEVYKYGMKSGHSITETDYYEIINDIVLKRAKKRALYLLTSMDRTENQLRNKLKQNEYTEDIIELVLDYVKKYSYIDDERYVKNYIESNAERKSRQKIISDLFQKGIDKEIINQIVGQYYQSDEKKIINQLLEKKKFNRKEATPKEIQKMFNYLYRRGFQLEDIKKVLHI
ncbi:regulatory protein RecX [Anaerosacchariphilus polymeriproducens]|uniref:Regulatory protein RecX n=1 Tax=Anaerosacchariphilus polymeriproducens TaxID=1812858 RepID=A0A371B0B2_9FIRM|nr:regulatory protein RecX [Anaerosacchariphilus polymeriproducens]RDU25241.1 regulatory protein RecX [Anaerosacchariphilus polymeriproducens]